VNLYALELSHHNTPVAVREKVRIDANDLPSKLLELRAKTDECFILSTCNRLLVIAVADGPLPLGQIADPTGRYRLYHRYFYGYEAVARHLFAVCAGLCSQLMGEDAIVAQVRDAYQVARLTGTLGPHLYKLLDRSLVASKHLRSKNLMPLQTYADVVWQLIGKSFHETDGKQVLLIGTGDVAKRLLPMLSRRNIRLTVLSRSAERLVPVKAEYPLNLTLTGNISASIAISYDVIIGATDAEHFLLSASDYAPPTKRQLWIDLGLPRNFDPALGQFDRIMLYDIDHLKSRFAAPEAHLVAQATEALEYEVEQYLIRYQRFEPGLVSAPVVIV